MHRHKSGKGWRNVMKMKRILTGMLGAAILAAGVNLLSVQAAENAGVMEYIAATEYIEETEAAEPENVCIPISSTPSAIVTLSRLLHP